MRSRFRWVVLALDAVVIAVVTLLAVELRTTAPFLSDARDVDSLVLPIAPAIALLWFGALWFAGAYRQRHWGVGVAEYRQVISASAMFLLVLTFLAYITGYPLSRGFVVILLLVGFRRLPSADSWPDVSSIGCGFGRSTIPTYVVGHGGAAGDLIDILRRESWLGYQPVGAFIDDGHTGTIRGLQILGSSRDLIAHLDDSEVAAVLFTSGSVHRGRDFNQLARQLENHRLQMIVVPALTDIAPQRIQVTPVAGLPLMHVDRPQADRALRLTKRMFDIVTASITTLLLSPLMLVVALLVKLDGGPALFRQERIGRNGEPFKMLKFRSMVVDAEQIRDVSLEDENEADGALFKIKKDPGSPRSAGSSAASRSMKCRSCSTSCAGR